MKTFISISGRDLILYIMLFALVAASFFVIRDELKPVETEKYKTIVVEQGDTLWALANTYQEKHEMDIQRFIDWVSEVNHINRYIIHNGQELVIPVKK